jgi:hypothetical protein
MAQIVGWIVWAGVVYLALTWAYGARKMLAEEGNFTKAAAVQTFFWWLLAVLFLFVPYSKLHLLWLVPVAFGLSLVVMLAKVSGGLVTGFPPLASLIEWFSRGLYIPARLFMCLVLLGVAGSPARRPVTIEPQKSKANGVHWDVVRKLAVYALLMAPPAMGILLSKSTPWKVLWWVVWIGWCLFFTARTSMSAKGIFVSLFLLVICFTMLPEGRVWDYVMAGAQILMFCGAYHMECEDSGY